MPAVPGTYGRSLRGHRTYMPEPLPPHLPLPTEVGREVEKAAYTGGQHKQEEESMNKIPGASEELFKPYALAALIGRFQMQYQSFDDPEFVKEEITYKRAAQKELQKCLSKEELDKLIAEGEFEKAKAVIKRVCGGTFNGVVNNLLNKFDRLSVANAPAEPLVRTLYDLLYGAGSFTPSFEAWVELLSRDRPGVWPTATYFLMMHDSSKHIFVKAESYKKLLHALHSKIEWETRPTATRYQQIQWLASTLLSKLAPMGAQDLLDVQSFIYTMFPTKV